MSELKLVWQDEFDGEVIDREKWGYEIGYIRNNELQGYTDRLENARLENSMLVIEGRKEMFENFDYTSASVNTKGHFGFKYGKLEMRAKLPKGQGIWPAFWTLGINIDDIGWPRCGEIDVMEMVGGTAGGEHISYATVHYPDEDGNHKSQGGGKYELEKGLLSDDFHIYSVDWNEKTISWEVDGNLFFTANIEEIACFHKEHYILLNLAIGGGWPGSPNEETAFPQKYLIDWVRVYKAEK